MVKTWLFMLLITLSVTCFAQNNSRFSLEKEIDLEYYGAQQLSERGITKGVEAFILGEHNELQVDQTAANSQINYILSFQDGNTNFVDALQAGDNNSISSFQIGNNNDFMMNQFGEGNFIELMVIGNNNEFDVSQVGNDNIYRRSFQANNVHDIVQQSGNGNEVDINLSMPLVVRQTGGMKIIIR